MKKLIYILVLVLFIAGLSYSQVTTLWQKSAATSSLPIWLSTTGNGERGLAYGMVGGNQRLYIVSRNSTYGNNIYVYNATNGDSVGLLNTIGISGGLFIINDVEVSSNGVIFVSNMTTDASAGANPFKVYRYTAETDTPVAVISYNTTVATRLGDKFTVTGSTADNSVTIWAASGNTKELYKFTTTDNGVTFTPTIINLPSLGTVSLGSAAVGPLPNGDFYYNAGGQPAQKFLANGTVIDTVSTGIIATGTNAIRFMSTPTTDEFFATYAYGPTNETGRIVKIPGGDLNLAELVGVTPILGTNGNVGGTGDLSIQLVSPSIYNVYVLGTNNGFGAYRVDLRPQLSGDYYVGAAGTGPGGTDPEYPSLRAAFQAINNSNITGNCTFYITSDITEVTTPGGIGLAVNPEPHTITFKPYTGVQPVITLPYLADGNSGPSGAMVIGIPMENNIAWNDLRTTKNIIFDGSNTAGGTTRDLTITSQTNSVGNAFPMTIVGDVSNMVIKNCKIYYRPQTTSTSNLFRAAVQIRARLQNSINWTPSNITLENNHISANFTGVSQGALGVVTVSLSPQPTNQIDGLIIRNNLIEGKQRTIGLGWSASTDVYDNELIMNQDVSATAVNTVIVAANIVPGSVVNIYNNVISSVSSAANAAAAGNTAISIESVGTYNVYNNMISGFNLTAANPTAILRGIAVTGAATANLYYNTIYMTNIGDIGTGSVAYSGIFINNGANDLKNNIIYSAEADFVTYCINRTGTTGTVTSNYNNFYPVSTTNGNVGFWNAAATPTLANWQTASGQDANSKSKQVFFVSATDLHLTGSSIGDFDLAGTPIIGITTDIDGDTRDANFPYMGADEGPIPLPVELASFAATVDKGVVTLKWTTASEINNRGFEVERGVAGEFITIGFVNGAGTSTEERSYSFIDAKVQPGVYGYRLKQIDFDGSFNYSNVIEIDISVPAVFDLAQNYPNPFNPATTIEFSVANPVNVTLTVFTILGEQIAVLVDNQFTEAGKHSVQFNASSLASGTYIYRIQAGDFVATKKMILAK